MLSEEANPQGLTALDHEVLTDFLHGTSTLPDLLKKRGLSGGANGGAGGAGDFLAWLQSPAVAAAIEAWEYLHELHFQAQLTRLRRAALDTLHEVAAATPNIETKRKAATTVITHIDRLFRAHPQLSPFAPRPHAPERYLPPSSPPGGGGSWRHNGHETEGARSSTPSTPPRPQNGAPSCSAVAGARPHSAPAEGSPCREGHASSRQSAPSRIGPSRDPQPERSPGSRRADLGVNDQGSSDESSSRATPGSRPPHPSDPEGVVVASDEPLSATRASWLCGGFKSKIRRGGVGGAPIECAPLIQSSRTAAHPSPARARRSGHRPHRPASLASLAGVIPDTS